MPTTSELLQQAAQQAANDEAASRAKDATIDLLQKRVRELEVGKPPLTPIPVTNAPAWTVLAPATGRVVYVSASGVDTNDGSEAKPFKTIAAALKLKPQRVWLNGGETFTMPDTFGLSGTTDQPAVIGSYGTGRATIVNPKGPALHLWFASDVLVTGLTLQGDIGLRAWNCNRVRIEDCDLSGSRINAELTGARRTNGVTFYGCIIADAHGTTEARTQGIYAEQVDGLVIEWSVLDHNGWSAGQAMKSPPEGNHGLYAHESCGPVTVRNSIIARSCATGLLMRTGGVVENCAFINNPIDLSLSGDDAKVTGSTFIGDQRLAGDATYDVKQYGERRGWGIDLSTATGTVTGNRFYAVPSPIRVNEPARTNKPKGVRVTDGNTIVATMPALEVEATMTALRKLSRSNWDGTLMARVRGM
jgi:hypothetical protein